MDYFLSAIALLAACTPAGTTATETLSLTDSPSPASTRTFTLSPANVQAATPTIALPPLLPVGLPIISPENAGQVTELARIGKGLASGLAWSPDGKLLAVGSSLGICIFNAQSHKEILFIESGNYVSYVFFSPDGTTLLSGSLRDGLVKIWRIADGALLRTLGEQADDTDSLALSPDGNVLALGTKKEVTLWRVADGARIRTWEITPSWRAGSAAFSPDGTILAAVTEDGVALWRVADGARLLTLPSGIVNEIAFSPDGRILAASAGGFVSVWRIADGAELTTLSGGDHPQAVEIMSLLFFPDGDTLAAAYSDGGITIWKITDGALIRTLAERPSDWGCLGAWTGDGKALAASPDGSRLASRSCTRATVTLWSMPKGEQVATLEGFSRSVTHAVISPSGKIMAVEYDGWRVEILRLPEGSFERSMDFRGDSSGFIFSPDASTLFVLSYSHPTLWRLSGELPTIELPDSADLIFCAVFTSDGSTLITGGDSIILWQVTNTKRIHEMVFTSHYVSSLAISPDGNLLAGGLSDTRVVLWRLSDTVPLQTWGEPATDHKFEEAIDDMSFSPDGSLLAIGKFAEFLLFRVYSGSLEMLSTSPYRAEDLAFSPDGSLLATAGDAIRIWRISDGELLATLAGHTNRISSIFFSPDGTFLGSSSYDGTIRFWGIS